MATLKESLLELFDGKNTKAYSKLVSSRADLYSRVIKQQELLNCNSLAEVFWCIINDVTPPQCACGNIRIFNTFNLGYRSFCGTKCTAKRTAHSKKIELMWKESPDKLEKMINARNKTNLKKYGIKNAAQSDEVKQKTMQTNIEKYGVEFPLQSKTVQDKIKQTMVNKYGVEYPFQSPIIRQKSADKFAKNNPDIHDNMQLARTAFIAKHGVNPFAVPEIKDKIYKARKEKYGYVHALQSHLSSSIVEILENKELFISSIAGLTISEAGEKLGVNATTIARRAIAHECRDVFVKSSRSKWEFKIKQFLLSIGLIEGVDFISGDRSILSGKELDFYFPKINAAIEVGSVFWHSEISAGRNDVYHYNKWADCYKQGIDLYQYWDFELSNSWTVIAEKIKYLFKKTTRIVGARQIKIFGLINVRDEKQFLGQYHLQGFSGDRQRTFGAYYNGNLIAVMALASRKTGAEIVRYATDLSASYPGLFSKLLKYSLLEMQLTTVNVFSYSDNRHSSGNVYKKSGFSLIKETKPNYFYTKNYHNVENKKKFTKQKIRSKFSIDIEDKTEWQLMQSLGYDRIWDAGKKLWKLPNPYTLEIQ